MENFIFWVMNVYRKSGPAKQKRKKRNFEKHF